MTDSDTSLALWREVTGEVTSSVPAAQVSDRVLDHHRQQLERSGRVALENLQAHDQFCKEIETYVLSGASERSAQHQQRVTDFAAYLLQEYENVSVRAFTKANLNILANLPREVEVTRVVHVAAPPPPKRSWLSRFFIG
jgi:hypothetical protein